MSDNINFQPSELRATSSHINAQAQELAVMLERVQRALESIRSSWQGQAASHYDALMAEYTSDVHGIRNVLGEVSHHLNVAAQSLENSDARGFVLESERPVSERKQISSNEGGSPSKIDTKITSKRASTLSIQIIQEPLIAQNLTTILTAITELYTKCWLITKGRFADLIDYTQTHNTRFDEEAGLIITKLSYNSPAGINFGFPNLDPEKGANAIITLIDGVTQRKARLEKLELEVQEKAQQIKQAGQKNRQDEYIATLEREKQELALERERLALLEQRIEVQKKGIEYALEIASKTIDVLHPKADLETRAMLIQTLLSNILQLQNSKGLELVLPAPGSGEEQKTK